jgi:predicted esterase
MNVNQLHAGLPVGRAGAPVATARAAMIMLHGRGAMAADILFLANELDVRQVAVLAPQAANATWYPNRFIAPVATNEPWLTSALQVVDGLVQELTGGGLGAERVFLLGFSQGGCLALEYAARFPRRYAGVIGLSSGLIENGDQPRAYSGSLDGTPVLLGCSDVDFHIPVTRVDRTADVLAGLGAAVDKRIYPGMDHTINRDEINAINALIAQVTAE